MSPESIARAESLLDLLESDFGQSGQDVRILAISEEIDAAFRRGAAEASKSLPPREQGQHCATCQCNAVHDERHVPGNSMSRSWHKNAGNGAPK